MNISKPTDTSTPTRGLSADVKRMRLLSVGFRERVSDSPAREARKSFVNAEDSFNLTMESEPGSPSFLRSNSFIQRCDSTACSPLIANDNNKLKMSVSSSTPFRLNACVQTLEESEGDSDVFDNQDGEQKFGGLVEGQVHAKRKRLSTTGYSQSVSSPSSHVRKKQRTGFDTPEIDISEDPLQFAKDEEGNLIGNFKAKCLLNIVNGPRLSFKYIEPMSLRDLLVNGHPNVGRIEIIDARYPYEFKGGHIKGALNVASQGQSDNGQTESVMEKFFGVELPKFDEKKRRIMVFHCEFSSERGPRVYKLFRGMDRKKNIYPELDWPEIYLLKDGYKRFWEELKDDTKAHLLFGVNGYKPMLGDTKELHQIRKLRTKAKTAPCFVPSSKKN